MLSYNELKLSGGIDLLKLEKLLQNIKTELENVKSEIHNAPEGYLAKRGTSYIHIKKEKQIGITKNPDLIRQLCRKKYLIARKVQLESLVKGEIDTRTPRQIIESFSKAYQSVPIDYFYHPETLEWVNKKKRRNTLFPEDIKYQYNGVGYRTLSERIVAEILTKNGFVFEYELRYDFGHAQVSPDFTMKNPFNDKTYIIEYYGAFNKKDYADKMNDKFDAYDKIGYIDGENLITLFEYHIREPKRIQRIIDNL